MGIKAVTLAAGMLAASATAALAWGEMYMGDGTNDPNSGQMFPYQASANYCPSGLQPIVMNGVICCGTPTTTEHYYNAPVRTKKRSHHRTRAYAPAGVKGVVYK
ncbi:hypothetical protein PGB28_07080 [Primorskyibacter aestuariivivens]|uniref:hypothetical protein n=1 Tax=Primorskyibacter aestuariivivens TaxID=1888912 RepID=UPI00230097EC|nr:hypothetical protein [Primorskyibacter aestuariivivens]MDA7428216.1 hypothetical protein [Primorskyibacter aestuariivivens]